MVCRKWKSYCNYCGQSWLKWVHIHSWPVNMLVSCFDRLMPSNHQTCQRYQATTCRSWQTCKSCTGLQVLSELSGDLTKSSGQTGRTQMAGAESLTKTFQIPEAQLTSQYDIISFTTYRHTIFFCWLPWSWDCFIKIYGSTGIYVHKKS